MWQPRGHPAMSTTWVGWTGRSGSSLCHIYNRTGGGIIIGRECNNGGIYYPFVDIKPYLM
jgi:hypothetical protein